LVEYDIRNGKDYIWINENLGRLARSCGDGNV
jgi:hypothetical protein